MGGDRSKVRPFLVTIGRHHVDALRLRRGGTGGGRSSRRVRGARRGELREFAWGQIALLSDPFGHGLCLLAFMGRRDDGLANG